MKTLRMLIILLTLLVVLAPALSPVAAQEPANLQLAERGPYAIGVQTLTFVDSSRENRELVTEIWYPSTFPESSSSNDVLRDATPDTSDAPYPLIIYSHGLGSHRLQLSQLTEHLASHGYVVVATDHRDDIPWVAVIDRPLDILFVLEQVTSITNEDLVGLIDGNRVGVTGYSLGGLTAILTAGAQIDPDAWPTACTGRFFDKTCSDVSDNWDDVAAYRSQFDPPLEENGLWPAVTDSRFKAVLPMAPGGLIFGEHGLDAVTMPMLIIGGTLDMFYGDAMFVYEQMRTADCHLLSFVNAGHNFPVAAFHFHEPMRHFATAFFGVYLQGKEDYAKYLTAEFVEQFEKLAWGPFETEQ